MRPDEYRTEMAHLHEALSGMDLPDHRRRPCNNDGLRWLARCLHERNAGHAQFERAATCLKALGHETSRPTRN